MSDLVLYNSSSRQSNRPLGLLLLRDALPAGNVRTPQPGILLGLHCPNQQQSINWFSGSPSLELNHSLGLHQSLGSRFLTFCMCNAPPFQNSHVNVTRCSCVVWETVKSCSPFLPCPFFLILEIQAAFLPRRENREVHRWMHMSCHFLSIPDVHPFVHHSGDFF